MSAWSDIWDVIRTMQLADAGQGVAAAQAVDATGAPQAVATGTGFWGTLGAFLTALTDWHLWASLGWLALGVGLIVLGLFLWLRQQDISPPAVLPVPV